MSRFRYGQFPYVTASGRVRGKAVVIEVMTSDQQILTQTDDQIMASIDRYFRKHLSSRRFYLQAENVFNGEEGS